MSQTSTAILVEVEALADLLNRLNRSLIHALVRQEHTQIYLYDPQVYEKDKMGWKIYWSRIKELQEKAQDVDVGLEIKGFVTPYDAIYSIQQSARNSFLEVCQEQNINHINDIKSEQMAYLAGAMATIKPIHALSKGEKVSHGHGEVKQSWIDLAKGDIDHLTIQAQECGLMIQVIRAVYKVAPVMLALQYFMQKQETPYDHYLLLATKQVAKPSGHTVSAVIVSNLTPKNEEAMIKESEKIQKEIQKHFAMVKKQEEKTLLAEHSMGPKVALKQKASPKPLPSAALSSHRFDDSSRRRRYDVNHVTITPFLELSPDLLKDIRKSLARERERLSKIETFFFKKMIQNRMAFLDKLEQTLIYRLIGVPKYETVGQVVRQCLAQKPPGQKTTFDQAMKARRHWFGGLFGRFYPTQSARFIEGFLKEYGEVDIPRSRCRGSKDEQRAYPRQTAPFRALEARYGDVMEATMAISLAEKKKRRMGLYKRPHRQYKIKPLPREALVFFERAAQPMKRSVSFSEGEAFQCFIGGP